LAVANGDEQAGLRSWPGAHELSDPERGVFSRLEDALASQLMGCPADVVLPRVEEVARSSQFRFVLDPDMSSDVHYGCALAERPQRLNDRGLEGLPSSPLRAWGWPAESDPLPVRRPGRKETARGRLDLALPQRMDVDCEDAFEANPMRIRGVVSARSAKDDLPSVW
jgi:hypothetical protein